MYEVRVTCFSCLNKNFDSVSEAKEYAISCAYLNDTTGSVDIYSDDRQRCIALDFFVINEEVIFQCMIFHADDHGKACFIGRIVKLPAKEA